MFFGTLMIMVGTFTSCDQNEDLNQVPQTETVVVDTSYVQTRVMAIPQKYAIDEAILQYFQHYCQRNAGTPTKTYPNAESAMSSDKSQSVCCPTSYMMAASCLARYKGLSYGFGGAKVESLTQDHKNLVTASDGTQTSAYKFLFTMADHANSQDGSFLRGYKSGDSPRDQTRQKSREKIKKFMESSLQQNRFVLVNVNCYLTSVSVVNDSRLYQNSLSNPDRTNSPYYITVQDESKKLKLGHVILIISIETNQTGDGVVAYIDPLAKSKSPSNRKYVKYSTLLNSMKISGSNDYYDAIAIGLK